jgi:4a-hydroxytetrahydrobiopterin dehydratase
VHLPAASGPACPATAAKIVAWATDPRAPGPDCGPGLGNSSPACPERMDGDSARLPRRRCLRTVACPSDQGGPRVTVTEVHRASSVSGGPECQVQYVRARSRRYDACVEPILPEELSALIAGLVDWQSADGQAITREFEFPDFGRAMAFMTAVAVRAERTDHHPEWSNVYRKVSVRLTTHGAGGLTRLDFELAAYMDEVAQGLGG